MKKEGKKKIRIGNIIGRIFTSLGAILMVVILVAANTLLPTYGRMVTELTGYRQAWKTDEAAQTLDLEYNKPVYETEEEQHEAEIAFNEQEEQEGAVLLKHTDGYMPYEEGTTFSLFSRSSVDYISGSLMGSFGGNGGNLKTALESRGFKVNEDLWNFYSEGAGSEHHRGSGSISYGADEDFTIDEAPLSEIQAEEGLEDSFK